MLSAEQIEELKDSCAEYGKRFRIAYPDHTILTPKVHLIEAHIVAFASHYRTIGIFGEVGMEATQPMDTRARFLVRSVRNVVQPHRALTNIIQTEQQHRKPAGPKRHRRNKVQMEMAEAAAHAPLIDVEDKAEH
jgi:hypothetical protein